MDNTYPTLQNISLCFTSTPLKKWQFLNNFVKNNTTSVSSMAVRIFMSKQSKQQGFCIQPRYIVVLCLTDLFQLFLIKHLLILREQIAPFDVEFSVREMTLDFTNLKGEWPRAVTVPQYRQYLPPLSRPPPPNGQYRCWFSSPEYVFLGYINLTPFTAVFQYRRFFAIPESSGIDYWGVDYIMTQATSVLCCTINGVHGWLLCFTALNLDNK